MRGMPAVLLQRLETELAELGSFVKRKVNRHWAWIAMDAPTRQIFTFYVGDRSGLSAEVFWKKILVV